MENPINENKNKARKLFLEVVKRAILSPGETISPISLSEIDWAYFMLLCLIHRLENLAYQSLKDYFSAMPQDIVLRLKGYWLQSQLKNQKDWEKIRVALAEFSKANIKVIPLKGMFLSHMLYGDINLRGKSCDFDVMIPSSMHKMTEEYLKNRGYVVDEDAEPEGFLWQKDAVKKDEDFVIDLHWNLSRGWQRGTVLDEMWQDAQGKRLDGIPYLCFSPEDELIYLSVHLADGDGYTQLLYVADIARFIHIFRNKIDFTKLLDKARRYHLTHSLYYGLLLASNIFGCEIPDWLSEKLKPHILKRMLVHSFVQENNLFGDTLTRRFIIRYFNFFLFDLIEAKGVKGHLRLIHSIFFTPQRNSRPSLGHAVKKISGGLRWAISECQKKR